MTTSVRGRWPPPLSHSAGQQQQASWQAQAACHDAGASGGAEVSADSTDSAEAPCMAQAVQWLHNSMPEVQRARGALLRLLRALLLAAAPLQYGCLRGHVP